MLFAEKDHASNPPSTWLVVKVAKGAWYLTTKGNVILARTKTKHEALGLSVSGPYVSLYEKEGRWFAGENIPGWKPYVRNDDCDEDDDNEPQRRFTTCTTCGYSIVGIVDEPAWRDRGNSPYCSPYRTTRLGDVIIPPRGIKHTPPLG